MIVKSLTCRLCIRCDLLKKFVNMLLLIIVSIAIEYGLRNCQLDIIKVLFLLEPKPLSSNSNEGLQVAYNNIDDRTTKDYIASLKHR